MANKPITQEALAKYMVQTYNNALLYPLDPPGYNDRVEQLESYGMTRSDAQGVADYEWESLGRFKTAEEDELDVA